MRAKFEIEVIFNDSTNHLIINVGGSITFFPEHNHQALYAALLKKLKETWDKENLSPIDITGMNKGDIMKIAYANNEEKLRQVDVALPFDYTKNKSREQTILEVTDYNDDHIFGKIVDLRKVAEQNGIKLIYNQ
jgi:hypothetical protein